jgi:hypothetical protein
MSHAADTAAGCKWNVEQGHKQVVRRWLHRMVRRWFGCFTQIRTAPRRCRLDLENEL